MQKSAVLTEHLDGARGVATGATALRRTAHDGALVITSDVIHCVRRVIVVRNAREANTVCFVQQALQSTCTRAE